MSGTPWVLLYPLEGEGGDGGGMGLFIPKNSKRMIHPKTCAERKRSSPLLPDLSPGPNGECCKSFQMFDLVSVRTSAVYITGRPRR